MFKFCQYFSYSTVGLTKYACRSDGWTSPFLMLLENMIELCLRFQSYAFIQFPSDDKENWLIQLLMPAKCRCYFQIAIWPIPETIDMTATFLCRFSTQMLFISQFAQRETKDCLLRYEEVDIFSDTKFYICLKPCCFAFSLFIYHYLSYWSWIQISLG